MSNIYKRGENRKQQIFFPPSIDEYVNENNQVRAIEDYVELLDMVELGLTKSALNSSDGQPAYHPKLLLKIYIYGYLNRIRSSRKLEKEIKRNIEMMWLCAELTPSYKTIADFRKDNAKALKKVFREFVLLCKELALITGELVAIDGAFLRANASKNQLIMKKSVQRDLKKIDEKIEAYLETMEFSDKVEKKERALKALPTNNLAKIVKRKTQLDKDLALLEEMGVTQYNRTDPDAKLMSKPAHNLMAYNVQIAVDNKYKFIVATDVSSEGGDSKQLYNMSSKAKEITQNEEIVVTADKGYDSAKEIKKCSDANIEVIVPIKDNLKAQKDKNKFTREDFIYDNLTDTYCCPNKQSLIMTGTSHKNEMLFYRYKGKKLICNLCPLRDSCLPEKTPYKELFRWEHEDFMNQHKIKMKTPRAKEIIKQRSAIVEHPFGTIKQSLGWTHFLVRGKEKVSGENALIMFTYNFRRLLNLIGIVLFRKLLIALKNGSIEEVKAEIVAYITYFRFYLLSFWKILTFLDFRKENVISFSY
jgi:transposase